MKKLILLISLATISWTGYAQNSYLELHQLLGASHGLLETGGDRMWNNGRVTSLRALRAAGLKLQPFPLGTNGVHLAKVLKQCVFISTKGLYTPHFDVRQQEKVTKAFLRTMWGLKTSPSKLKLFIVKKSPEVAMPGDKDSVQSSCALVVATGRGEALFLRASAEYH